MKIQKTMLAAALALASLASQASVTVGTYTFEDNALADGVVARQPTPGSFSPFGVGTFESLLTDKDVYTGVFNNFDAKSTITLSFSNGIVNGDGNDLVLFDLGSNDRFYFPIAGAQEDTYPGNVPEFNTDGSLNTGSFKTFKVLDEINRDRPQVNALEVDLSILGVAKGATVNQITIGMNLGTFNPQPGNSQNNSRPTLSLAAALHTNAPAPVPEPETYAMLLAGLGAIGAAVRRRKQAK